MNSYFTWNRYSERGPRKRLTGAHPLPFVLPHACALGGANHYVVRWAGLVVATVRATRYAAQASTGACKGSEVCRVGIGAERQSWALGLKGSLVIVEYVGL